MISNILEIGNIFVLKGFLVTIDIEKPFDSVNHILRKFGVGIDFVNWIETILKNQEFCIIKEGKTANISS